MSFGDILYVIAMILFAYITFGIVRSYYKKKFNDDGQRIDMLDDDDKDNPSDN